MENLLKIPIRLKSITVDVSNTTYWFRTNSGGEPFPIVFGGSPKDGLVPGDTFYLAIQKFEEEMAK